MSQNIALVRVRYAETDQMGVVYHANYIVWMEVGRTEYCRAAGIVYRDLEEQEGLHLAVVEASCRYVSPARYDDEIEIHTSIAEAHPRMIRFAYELVNKATGKKVAEGSTKHVFLNREMKLAKLPPLYFPKFGIVK